MKWDPNKSVALNVGNQFKHQEHVVEGASEAELRNQGGSLEYVEIENEEGEEDNIDGND